MKLNQNLLEKIKTADAFSFARKMFEKTEHCVFCGSEKTWDLAVIDNELKVIFYYRPINDKNEAVCLKHHLLASKIDKFVTKILKILFKLI